jgi:hypothetical protein
LKRHIRRLIEKRKDQRRMGFDPAGATVAAQRFGTRIANRALKGSSADRARRADPEALGRLAAGHSARNRFQDTNPKIERKSFRHVRRPPAPADSLNQIRHALGIPKIQSVRITL